MLDIIKTAVFNVFHEDLKSAGISVLQDIVTVVQHYEVQGSSELIYNEMSWSIV